MHKLLHKIFGHKIYYVRTEKNPGFEDTHNVYKCLGCNEEFHSGIYWWVFDMKGKRVK